MPTAPVVTPKGYVDYVSASPLVAADWSVQSLGMGFYSLKTPGASVSEVTAWAEAAGATSIEPNQVLVKQNLDTDIPNDPAYVTYQWGLNNTGTPANALSPESAAAAELRNGPDIFPRTRDADIDAPEAWYLQKGNPEVIVAVFDDGIDSRHPDLAENMWSRERANLSLPLDNQIPAFRDDPAVGVDRHGFNSAEFLADNFFYEGSPAAPYSDPDFVSTRPGDERLIVVDPNNASRILNWRGANNSHGTHVAGIIGAKGNNGLGISGVNWTVSLYSANIFRYGDYDAGGYRRNADQTGSMDAFIHAVNRIRILKTQFQQNFVVANLSFNTYIPSTAMEVALGVLTNPVKPLTDPTGGCGMLVVVAAGNGYDPCLRDGVGDLIGGPLCQDDMTYPAGYKNDFPNMIVVTASNAQDELPRFANWGPTVDIAAPGENIWSTVPLSMRRYHLANDGLFKDVPVQYDSFEPFWRPLGDPPSPPPPSGGDVVFLNPGPISRPYMVREVPRGIQQYNPGDPAASLGAYGSKSGTSMATAYVSGVAALMAAEFYRWTDAVPSAAYLKQGILTQADSVSTLIYVEGTNDPPFDYQHAPTATVGRVPIRRTGMYETATDPGSRTHSIPGNLRLNAYKGVWWVRNNLPPSITIIDQPETPANRGESRLEGDAGLTPFLYSAVISGGTLDAPVTIRAWTEAIISGVPNPATPGVDYVPISQASPVLFTIPTGVTTFNIPEALFSVSVIGDPIPEANESFRIRFSVDSNPQSVWMSTKRATSIIIDDDPTDSKPLITISRAPATITEGKVGTRAPTRDYVEFSLTRPSGKTAARAVLIPYTITAGAVSGAAATMGSDFIGASSMARIPAGKSSVRVPVNVIGDTTPEAPEQFQVVLGNPNLGVKKRNTSRATITILDNAGNNPVPPPPVSNPIVSLGAALPASVAEGGSVDIGINVLGAPVNPGFAIAVYYTVSGGPASRVGNSYVGAATIGSDVVGTASRKMVIPAGTPSSTIKIDTRTDRFVEGPERFTVRLTRAILYKLDGKAKPVTLALGTSSVAVTIDDVPPGS